MNEADYAREVIKKETEAVAQLTNHINNDFIKAVFLCRECPGNIVISGVGKSGFIAQKMAATLASLGFRSWWLHPNDAEHGDIGRVTSDDVCVLFSYSGSTKEIVSLAALLRSRKSSIIAITGNPASDLARLADIIIHLGNFEEAGLVKLIPTSSTTASLAMGDALALAIAGTNLKPGDFGKNHPGGSIGLRLSPVNKIMRKDDACAIVKLGTSLLDTLLLITEAGSGAAIVVDNDKMVGIMTDGDFRRWVSAGHDVKANVEQCMSIKPLTIESHQIVEEALDLFRKSKIGELPVLENGRPVGMISLKDLTKVTY